MLHIVTNLHHSTLHYMEVKFPSITRFCSLCYQYCVCVSICPYEASSFVHKV